MEKERKIRILSIGALLVAIIGLTVAFAAMSRTLIINGTATIDSAKWDIHFANPLLKSKKGDAREVSAPVISEDGGELTLKVGLRKPQDEIVYNVDVVNSGDIDAEITKIDYPELSEEHAKIIEFEAVYDDGSSIALAQELKASESKKVKITIRFKDVTDESLLASEAYDIPLTFKNHYTQSGVSNGGTVTPDGGGDSVDCSNIVFEPGKTYGTLTLNSTPTMVNINDYMDSSEPSIELDHSTGKKLDISSILYDENKYAISVTNYYDVDDEYEFYGGYLYFFEAANNVDIDGVIVTVPTKGWYSLTLDENDSLVVSSEPISDFSTYEGYYISEGENTDSLTEVFGTALLELN